MPTRKTKNNKNGKKNKSLLVSPLFISLVFSFRFIAIKRKRQSVASRPFIIIIIIICLVVCLLCVCVCVCRILSPASPRIYFTQCALLCILISHIYSPSIQTFG